VPPSFYLSALSVLSTWCSATVPLCSCARAVFRGLPDGSLHLHHHYHLSIYVEKVCLAPSSLHTPHCLNERMTCCHTILPGGGWDTPRRMTKPSPASLRPTRSSSLRVMHSGKPWRRLPCGPLPHAHNAHQFVNNQHTHLGYRWRRGIGHGNRSSIDISRASFLWLRLWALCPKPPRRPPPQMRPLLLHQQPLALLQRGLALHSRSGFQSCS